jgi:hypothetical protein
MHNAIWINELIKQVGDYLLQTSQPVVQSSEQSHKMPLNLWSSTAAIISIGNLSFTCIYTFGTISSLHNTYGELRILFNPTMWFVVPLLFPQLYLLCSDCIPLYLGLVNWQVRTKHMCLQKHSNCTNTPLFVSPRGHKRRLTTFLCMPPYLHLHSFDSHLQQPCWVNHVHETCCKEAYRNTFFELPAASNWHSWHGVAQDHLYLGQPWCVFDLTEPVQPKGQPRCLPTPQVMPPLRNPWQWVCSDGKLQAYQPCMP